MPSLVPTYKKTLGFFEPTVGAQIMIVWHFLFFFFYKCSPKPPTQQSDHKWDKGKIYQIASCFDIRLQSVE